MTSDKPVRPGESRPLERSKYDYLFIAALALLVVLFFREVVVFGKVFYFRDFGLFFYPKRWLAAEAARHLQVPFWENLSAAGGPVLGTYQVAFFYPLSLAYYALPMPWSLMAFVVAHVFVAGAGTYYMLRAWRAGRLAAATGALAWAFAPTLVGLVDQVSFVSSLAWLPWCVAFAKRTMDASGAKPFVGLAASFAMCVLAGAPEPVIFAAALVAMVALWEAALSLRTGFARAAGRAALAVAALLVGALVAGVELGPFLYLLMYSDRGEGLSSKMAGFWSLTPADIRTWLLPRFYLQPSRGGVFWSDQGWMKTVYLGAAVPVLAAWAVLAARRRREVFFALAGLLFLAFAFGKWSPLWRVCFDALPGFALVRFPVKFFLPAAFAATVLAALAVDEMLARAEAKRPKAVYAFVAAAGTVGLTLVVFWLALGARPEYFKAHVIPPKIAGAEAPGSGQREALEALQFDMSRWSVGRSGAILLVVAAAAWALAALPNRRAMAALLGAMLALDAAFFADTLNPVAGSSIYTEKPSHLSAVDTSPGAGRLYTSPILVKYRNEIRLTRFAGVEGLMRHLMLLKGDRYASPEAVKRWTEAAVGARFSGMDQLAQYIDAADPALSEVAGFEFNKETFYPNLHLLYGVPSSEAGDVLLVRWQARLLNKLDRPQYDRGVRGERLFAASRVVDFDRAEPHFRYGVASEGRPRAMLVDRMVSVASDDDALEMVVADGFDPAKAVVLFRSDAEEARRFLTSGGASPDTAPGGIKWTADEGNTEALEVTSPRAALLYVADTFFPAFRATVDRRPAPLYRANYAFRAVPVPAGAHRVEIRYVPVDFYAGLVATVAGLIALVVVAAALRAKPAAERSA